METKPTESPKGNTLDDIQTLRFAAKDKDGFQLLRRELFQDVATLPAVIRYCALGGLKHELARLKKRRAK